MVYYALYVGSDGNRIFVAIDDWSYERGWERTELRLYVCKDLLKLDLRRRNRQLLLVSSRVKVAEDFNRSVDQLLERHRG